MPNLANKNTGYPATYEIPEYLKNVSHVIFGATIVLLKRTCFHRRPWVVAQLSLCCTEQGLQISVHEPRTVSITLSGLQIALSSY